MPQSSSITFIIGAALFVVQEALEIMLAFKVCVFSDTPKTTMSMVSSSGGTDKITFLAPLFMWYSKSSRSLNLPEHSITTSKLKPFQLISLG